MNENEISKVVVDAAVTIHKTLGPGLLESVYERVMCYELQQRGLSSIRQAVIPVKYRDIEFEEGFRADIIVENKVVLEIKSVECTMPAHKKQLLTYLRFTNAKLGLLLNFGENLMRHGITRVVNGLDESTDNALGT